ncbi:kinase-like protein [Metschnikowia bicuspidata]|uniref:Kinase-like protein n=1 Tax=Metschnikowia bicuspidata TaxID=27322 RepID=A0A4P9ZD94_9ASCO|nr:kinase-like protein [Metschnikowia bicuspidata]
MLEPGVVVIVGCHSVKVVRFLSEGGYSQIYESKSLPSPRVACLKQVKVADKAGLAELRKEVEVMRTLENARNIVKYFDSHAERLPDGTYQVLVLMELCPNRSLLDYMNAHIREKLTESQILTIMMDIAVGVYEMHRLHLVHRDIKIENVLIDAKHRYKLCDFGSVSKPIRPPKDQHEFQLLSHNILYHTTPQYRAPEMLDLTRGVPIDCKSDIWAIGCFLYKLCYYTTPFEAAGDIAILHASFQFPPSPLYSGDLKNLIIIMLQQDLRFRPNIVQILMLLARMCNQDFNEMGIEDYTKTGPKKCC